MLLHIAPQLLLASAEELGALLAQSRSALQLALAATSTAATALAAQLAAGGATQQQQQWLSGGGGWGAQEAAFVVQLQQGGQSFWGGEVGAEAAAAVVAAELRERALQRDHLRLCALKLCGQYGVTLEELNALLRDKPTLLREVRL